MKLTLNQGDTARVTSKLEDSTDGGSTWVPRNLTGCTVRFVCVDAAGAVVVNAAGVVDGTPTAGVAGWDPAGTEFAAYTTETKARVEWHVTDGAGVKRTYPQGAKKQAATIVPALAVA